jgi:radical SAM superfamily enzyme YgiQ (UPF0313 family)
MKILFVYPKYPDTFWSYKHALRFLNKKAAIPPLGLLTVAAMLPETWEKKLVDLNTTELKDDELKWADMVFISAMIIQKSSVQEVIARCKALGKTVVAGGPLFTAQSEQFKGVDHLILNEAEVTLPLFLRDLDAGKAKPLYTSQDKPVLTETPVPLWSLIPLENYAVIPVQYSRGCPFSCEFCDIIIMYGRTPRTKTPQQLVGELQSLYEAGWRGDVFIVDDNFIGNKANVKKLLPVLIEWQKDHQFPFSLMTEASVNLADDDELMQLMNQANFQKVFVGIETPDLAGLKGCGKTQNASRSLPDSVKTIQQHGMQVMAGFILGFDTDTETIFQQQIDFIQETGIVTAMVGLLNALPHTPLWHRLNDEGRLLKETTGENTDGSLNFSPLMGAKDLIEGYQKILSTIYSHKYYYRRIGTFMRNYKPNAQIRNPKKEEILAFFRSTWHIGVLSKARIPYWKLMIKTLLFQRNAFPAAVELAISGQHFLKTTKKILAMSV